MRLPPKPRKPDPLERLLAESMYSEIPVTMVAHCEAVPLGVMVRGTMEWMLDEATLEKLFQEHGGDQYTRELTIAALVGLVIQVSAGTRASVHAAYKADQASDEPTVTTSMAAVYGKLGRMEIGVSEALARYSGERCAELLALMPQARDEPLPGYRLRVLDGNVLAGSEHRLTPLRQWLNACLPGKSLVIYEPGVGLVTDVVLCEDAYTQERALVTQILPRLAANDLLIADRNFCTSRWVFGAKRASAFVIVRQHRRSLPCKPFERLKACGKTERGKVYEQRVLVTDSENGELLTLRRIEVRLYDKTRDGERTIALFSNLPAAVSAQRIAELYLERWSIEKHFQFLTQSLHCELPGLGKPKAALFGFAMALVAANALAVVRASLRSAHGHKVEATISGYYLADEIAHDYRTLMKYLPAGQWQGWRSLSPAAMARLLPAVAQHVNTKALTRSQRGPKKPPKVKPVYDKKHKHYSTARLLDPKQREPC
jgi:IS4 transposase